MMLKTFFALGALAATAMAAAPKGKAFDHIFIIWLENTDYSLAASTPELEALLPQGIALTNYYGVTHPSEPNYIAAAGGDYFGMSDDAFYAIPANYTTIVDLMEPKGLTWKAYQEDAPSPCFAGYEYNGTYFRKHNPFIIYDSIALNSTRCNNIVPLTNLAGDLANGTLPNYAFITPNMVNDGHNTTVKVAAEWVSGFLTPLLSNPNFLKNTLVVVTFDESETYTKPNNVWAALLGDSVAALKNTTDSTFYTHYSLLSTVEANWDLGNLGRNDANPQLSNVFSYVAALANVTNVNVTNPPLLNSSLPGFLTPSASSSGPTSSPKGSNGSLTSGSPVASGSTTSAGNTLISGITFVVAGFAAVFAAML